jgi:hypothetical protein
MAQSPPTQVNVTFRVAVPSPEGILQSRICGVTHNATKDTSTGTVLGGIAKILVLPKHIVYGEDGKQVPGKLTIFYENKPFEFDPVPTSLSSDLCLVRVTAVDFPVIDAMQVIPVSNVVVPGMEVNFGAHFRNSISYHKGYVAAVNRSKAVPVITVDGVCLPGFSGSPVCVFLPSNDNRGQFVGFKVALIGVLVAQHAQHVERLQTMRKSLQQTEENAPLTVLFDYVMDNLSTGISLVIPLHEAFAAAPDVMKTLEHSLPLKVSGSNSSGDAAAATGDIVQSSPVVAKARPAAHQTKSLEATVRQLPTAVPSELKTLALLILHKLDADQFHPDCINVSAIDDDGICFYWRTYHFEVSLYCEDNNIFADVTTRTVDTVTNLWKQDRRELSPISTAFSVDPGDVIIGDIADHLRAGFTIFNAKK